MAQRSSLEVQNFFKRFDAFRLDHMTLKIFDFFVEELEKDGKKKKKKKSASILFYVRSPMKILGFCFRKIIYK